MGKDNQPKHRQRARVLKRHKAKQAPHKRLLIVCEGGKTEPRYFEEIRQEYHLRTANVRVLPGVGTQPLQVVSHAEKLFRMGEPGKGIYPLSFDYVFAVFDRDEHSTYSQALDKAASLDGKLKNDMHERVSFQAIASVPCFELWLLLHFVDILAPIHRKSAYKRLKQYLPGYEKGQGGHWAATKNNLPTAIERAKVRAVSTTAYNGKEPYTDIHRVVSLLTKLKG